MKLAVKTTAALIAVLVAYFALWPSSVDPVAWEAPQDAGYTGAFEPNERLAELEVIALGDTIGPEDIVAREEEGGLALYASSQQGTIWRIDPISKVAIEFAQTDGFPLGLAWGADGALLVADAYRGLLSVSDEGTVRLLTNSVDGAPIVFADDVIAAPDGMIYFTDASQRFGAEAGGSPLAASVEDIFEQSQTGRVLRYDPKSGKTSVFAEGLSFANGIALSSDGAALLVAQTGFYRMDRFSLSGPNTGKPTPVLTNLPGFPDNISEGPVGPDNAQTYFVGLAGPRVPVLDDLADSPTIRKVISRIPAWARPPAVPYSLVLQFTEDGTIVQTWQDPAGGYPNTTGAIAPGDGFLYVTSVDAAGLGRVPFR
ncbi:MAG: SMP-30/gluconolactonase/LRE family protein [Pseudomonadota bacterium]